MKINTIIGMLAFGGSLLLTSEAMGQERADASRAGRERIDSLETALQDAKQDDRKARDEENMSALKDERKDTRAKAKEAQRVERDANDAARESKHAYRAEKKAQKARKHADLQAKKAAKARDTSDGN